MKTTQAIDALGALAHPHRLAAYRALVVRGPAGLRAGLLAEQLDLAPSSLTFHLQNLQRAGLLTQRREGRQLLYAVNFKAMNALVAYLTENCCGGEQVCSPTNAAVCEPAKTAKRPLAGRRRSA